MKRVRPSRASAAGSGVTPWKSTLSDASVSPRAIHHCATVTSIVTPPVTATECTYCVDGALASFGSPSDTRVDHSWMRLDGSSCVVCSMKIVCPPSVSRDRGAPRTSSTTVAHVAPAGGTTKRRSMWPGVKGRPSYAAYEQPPLTARRSACGLITVTGTRKRAPSPACVVSVPSTSAKWAPGGSDAQPTLRSKPFLRT